MVESSRQVLEIWKMYNGNSLFMILFLCCIMYLFVIEKNKEIKVLFLIVSIVILGLFIFPLFSYVMIKRIFDGEVYYRFLWFLPSSFVLAHTAVKLINVKTGRIKRSFILIGLITVLMFSGDYVYDNPTFERAENRYHLPDEVIQITDYLLEGETRDWVMAVFPEELISYVRQYSTRIHMPYGRAVLIDRWSLGHPMYETMESEVIDAELLCGQGELYQCNYIILKSESKLTGNMEDYNYILIAEMSGYDIYENRKLDRSEYEK